MQKEKKERHLLEEIFKNVNIGMQSVNDLISKVEDDSLKNELARMYENYDKFSTHATVIADEENFDVKEINSFKKAMIWTSIQFNTIKDNSTNHILSMLIKGSVTGYTTLIEEIHKSAVNDGKIYDLAMELVQIEKEDEKRLTALLTADK